MLTMRCCLPNGEGPPEARIIFRPEICEKEKSPKSGPKRKVPGLLCALFAAALFPLSWGAQWALAQEWGSPVFASYQQDASHREMQGRTRQSSAGRKLHPRSRKVRTHLHRLRTKRAHAKVGGRHGAVRAMRHARHLRHRRYYARRGVAPRVSLAGSGGTRVRKTPPLAKQGARPPVSRFFFVGRPDAKPPLKADAPAAAVPERAPAPAAAAVQAMLVEVGGDGMISANVKNRPLGEILRLMAEQHLFEIRGPLPGKALSTPVSMEFSDLTLDEVFDKVMRGFNYAFIREDVSEKKVLMVLGEITRTAYQEPAKSAQPPAQAGPASPQTTGGAPVATSPPQAGGGAAEGVTAVQPGRVANVPQRGRPNAEGLPAPAGQVQGVETPQAPAQEQKSPDEQGLSRPGTAGGPEAAPTPPKPEGESPAQEERPSDGSTLGSF